MAHILYFQYISALGVDYEISQKLLTDEVSFSVRDMIREICRQEDVEIIKGHASQDHIHLFVSIPPQVTVSRFV